MNNLQVLIARIGSSRKRKEARALLVESGDLPGVTWEMTRDSVWRTGAWGFKRSEAGRRAHRMGAFSAARGFVQKEAKRTLWVEVMIFGCEEDAKGMVPTLEKRLQVNPNAPVKLIAERKFEEHELPGVAYPWVYEQLTTGAPGGASATRFVGESIDRIVFLAACSGYVGSWPWEEVTTVASLQAEKIRRELESRSF